MNLKAHLLILALAAALPSCATKPKPSQAFFGGEQGQLAPARDAEPPPAEAPNEAEVDTGLGIAVTVPDNWDATEATIDGGMVLTSPAGSVIVIEAYKDDGGFLEKVKAWHADFAKLAEPAEALTEEELAGGAAWKASYQLLVEGAVVRQTFWEVPRKGHFYRINVAIAAVSDGHATRTTLDSLRFVDASRESELHGELLNASVTNGKLSDSTGSAKIAISGWEKAASCDAGGCAQAWIRDDAVAMLIRRNYASATSASTDLPQWVSRFERMGDSVSPSKLGKNAGYLVRSEGSRTWFGAFGTNVWILRLTAHPSDVDAFQKQLEKAIAAARFK